MISPDGQDEMHSRLFDGLLESGRLMVGSVRNPWDWYVSLWGYGCDGNGVLRSKLAGPRRFRGHGYRESLSAGCRNLIRELGRHRKFWEEVYSDSNSPELFRKWLQALLDSPLRNSITVEGFNRSSLSGFAGLYSYRYCFQFHKTTQHLFDSSLRNSTDLIEADRKHNAIDLVIRMENIAEGIEAMLRESGTSVDAELIDRISSMGRTNPSSRKGDLSFYYDRECLELVRIKDILIVEKYGYQPPEVRDL